MWKRGRRGWFVWDIRALLWHSSHSASLRTSRRPITDLVWVIWIPPKVFSYSGKRSAPVWWEKIYFPDSTCYIRWRCGGHRFLLPLVLIVVCCRYDDLAPVGLRPLSRVKSKWPVTFGRQIRKGLLLPLCQPCICRVWGFLSFNNSFYSGWRTRDPFHYVDLCVCHVWIVSIILLFWWWKGWGGNDETFGEWNALHLSGSIMRYILNHPPHFPRERSLIISKLCWAQRSGKYYAILALLPSLHVCLHEFPASIEPPISIGIRVKPNTLP